MTAPSGPGIVSFNYNEWLIQYPEFGYVSSAQAQFYFNRATLYCDNTPASPITDLFQRTVLLNMATAHVAKLFAAPAGQAPGGIVGRINSASQGSVSVQAAYREPTSDLEAWFNQTSYGAAFWAATTPFRTGFYVPAPPGANANQGLRGLARLGFWRL